MLELNEVQLFKGDPENIWGEQIKQPENILSMEVTEKMNDNLTLTMVCAISDFNIENLVIGNIIKCYKDVLKKSKRQVICWIENHIKKIDNYIEN